MTLLHPCRRCKRDRMVTRKRSYCTDCREQMEGVFCHRVIDCPLETATAFVERFTKQPRSRWEGTPGHPFNRAVVVLAKKLAGVK